MASNSDNIISPSFTDNEVEIFFAKNGLGEPVFGYKLQTSKDAQWIEFNKDKDIRKWVPVTKNSMDKRNPAQPVRTQKAEFSEFSKTFLDILGEEKITSQKIDSWIDCIFNESFLGNTIKASNFSTDKEQLRSIFDKQIPFKDTNIEAILSESKNQFEINTLKKELHTDAKTVSPAIATQEIETNTKIIDEISDPVSEPKIDYKKLAFSNPKVWLGTSIVSGILTTIAAALGKKRKAEGQEENPGMSTAVAIGTLATVSAIILAAISMWNKGVATQR